MLPTESTSWKAYASTAPVTDNTDADADNNNDIDRNITTYPRADLAVEFISPDNASVQQQGTVVNYGIQVSNTNSPYAYPLNAGEKAVVRFALPAGTSWQGSPTSPGNVWACVESSDTTSTPPTPVQTCTYTAPSGGVPKGANLPLLTIPVTVTEADGNTDATVSVMGQTTGGASFIDAYPDNNGDEVGINFAPNTQMDMRLVKSVAPTVLDKKGGASQNVTYTMKSTRLTGGLQPSGEISITDTLPTGVTFTAATQAAHDVGWDDCSVVGQALTCKFHGTVNTNGSLPDLVFTAAVDVNGVAMNPDTGNKVLTNSATLNVANEPLANTGNNQSSANLTISDKASLKVEKSPSVPGAIKDETVFSWDIKVTNTSDVKVLSTSTVTVTDELDAMLEYVPAATESPWSCSAVPATWSVGTRQKVTCTLNEEIAPAAAKTLKIKVRAHIPDTLEWATIKNKASAVCPTDRICPGLGTDGFVSIESEVNLSEKMADLSIKKFAEVITDNSVTGGTTAEVKYTLNVKNAVPNPLPPGMFVSDFQTAQTVVVEDVVTNLLNTNVNAAVHPVTGTPRYSNNRFVEATYDTVNGVTGSCAYDTTGLPANQVKVTCRLLNVPVGDTVYPITIKARQFVNPSADGDQTNKITNTATVGSPDTAEDITTNNTDTAEVKLTALTNLKATKTASPIAALAGQPITYTLSAQNQGPSQARVVKLVDTLPVGMIWVTAPSIANSSSCTLSGGGVIAVGAVVEAGKNTLTCAWPANQAYGVGTRTITYTLRSANTGYPASVTNNVQVETATQETIPLTAANTDNKASQVVTLDTPQVDVLINMKHTNDGIPLTTGSTQYTITVTNNAASTSYATGVVMTEEFFVAGSGAKFSFDSLDSITSSDGSHVFPLSACTVPATGATAGQLVCNFPWLKPGEVVEIKFTMKPAEILNGKPTGTIYHSASVSADVEQMSSVVVADNNQTTDRTSTYDPALLPPGTDPDDLRYIDLSVTKDATGVPADGLAVGDEFTYTLVVKNEESPAETPPLNLVNGNAVLTDTLPDGLDLVGAPPAGCTYANRTVSCTITTLAAGASLPYSLNVKVTQVASGQTPIANIAKVTSPGDPVDSNNESTKEVPTKETAFDLSLAKSVDKAQTQAGDTLTYTLVVTNHGPAQSKAGQISDPLPAGLTFVASPEGCTATGTTVSCSANVLADGASQTFTFTAMVADTVTGPTTLANTATVTADGDTNPDNNQDTAETTVQGFDLSLLKSVDKAQTKAGDTLTYTLVVTNHGPVQSKAGQISDPLPAGLSFVASPEGCTAAGTTVSCSVAALANGASQAFTFTALVADTVKGPTTLANTATVTADGDTNPGNNQSTVETPVPGLTTPTPVPTLSQWGQVLMAALLAMLGLAVLHRRLGRR